MAAVRERIKELQALMRERNIDAYLVTSSDYHDSEYVSRHFECREFITGFTGSAGTALITKDWAGLWTDGRYYIQAEAELKGSGVVLMKDGMPGVPGVEDFIEQDIPNFGTLGFDGRVISAAAADRLAARLESKHIRFACTEDLIGDIWEDRPPLPADPVWILEEKYSGMPSAKKIARLRREMQRRHADLHILTSLDDIAWLLNLRGSDVPDTPVFLAYMAVLPDKIYLFIDPGKVSADVENYLKALGVSLCPYQEIYSYVSSVRHSSVLLDRGRVNYTLVHGLDASNRVIDAPNPTSLYKAVKNPTEIANMEQAALTDGVVMTRFLYWVRTHVGREPLTECSLAGRLDEMRRQAGSLEPSFDTISAYGANAAMPHYHAEPGSDAEILPEGLYLVDSGGQYLTGTTDLTRTIALGPVSDEAKRAYTLVLKGMLDLAAAEFKEGCTGECLDYLARRPLWSKGLDYNHGTGHGVGYLLSCHESPVAVRYRINLDNGPSCVLEPGMVTSDEPGYYDEGNYGVRIENLLLVEEGKKTEAGTFLRFRFLTYAPIDTEPLILGLLTAEELSMLNAYHEEVYRKISPFLNPGEAAWLYDVTRPVEK